MPWKERDAMDLRYEFVLRSLQEGIPFMELCREYGIAPKTGYKWKERFLREGYEGLKDRSRKPATSPQGLEERVVCDIIKLKQAHMSWGPRKIRSLYGRKHARDTLPSESTFKRVLERAGLVQKRRRARSRDGGQLKSKVSVEKPNDLWTVDFKGWWHLSGGGRCEPLTIRDEYSRYLLCVSVPENAKTGTVQVEFERVFNKYGLPQTIRSDNGRPFAAYNAPLGLSRLSVWWLALGIDLDRIDRGRPDQNGGHERMHRDIAWEIEGKVSGGLKHQRKALEIWRQSFNNERPHEALDMRCPADLYEHSRTPFKGTPERLEYPDGYIERKVHSTGTISLKGSSIQLTSALKGWHVGLKHLGDTIYSVHFARLCLGTIDLSSDSFCTPKPMKGGGLK